MRLGEQSPASQSLSVRNDAWHPEDAFDDRAPGNLFAPLRQTKVAIVQIKLKRY